MANYNPYENMLHVLDKAAEVLGYQKEDYEFVRYPERELTVSIPVTMDDGKVQVFSGYRVQHNTARGAAKGGIRYHPASDENEATGRGLTHTLETWCEKNNKKMNELTMLVQGFGNVGSVGSLLMHRAGVKIICVGDINGTWYKPEGLDIEAMYVYANSHGRSLKGYTEEGASLIDDDKLFEQDVDVVFVAAMENQLNENTMRKVKAKLVLEGADHGRSGRLL